ncbi:MAG: hypothetical protein DRO43_05435 [Candidatus Hecatellales archaeon]|nr:MAG: hypothetical protein DRO43_05435 [Candidatus Hecatellales archaeon]
MKLLLVNPYFQGVTWAPTLGLGFIGTYVKENSNWDVEIVEPILENLNEKQVLAKAGKADIVGLSCYTESRFQCFSFAKKVKEVNPDCKVVVGGPHVNSLDRQILEHYPFVDIVVRFEGEEAMLEIVSGKPLKEIKGISWRSRDKIVRNPDRPLADINRLHYDYALTYERILKNWKDVETPHELRKRKHIPIIASRGCPFKCTFCATPFICRGVWRSITPEKLVEQMKFLADKYKIGYFRFYDALFIGDLKKTARFCSLLKEEKLDVNFRIDIRAGTPRDILEKLRKVGCVIVGVGVESGSNRILKKIKKGATRDQIIKTIRNCRELGYWSIGYFMVSLPGEAYEDVEMTLSLFKYFDVFNFQFFKVHPDTEIYRDLKSRGEIDDEIWFDEKREDELFYCKDNFPSAFFARKEADLIIHRIYLDFDRDNPKVLLRRHGLKKGIMIYPLEFALSGMLKTRIGRKAFCRVKDMNVYDVMLSYYRKFCTI